MFRSPGKLIDGVVGSRFTRSVALTMALGLALPAVGCATQATSEVDETTSTIEGVIHVERTATDDGATTSVSAKFMRILPSDSAAAERLVGTRVVLPAVGECAAVSALQPDVTTSKLKGSVELVDVGDLTLLVRGGAHAASDETNSVPISNVPINLAPRAFPDVGDMASGVFYTSPDATRDLPSPARFAIKGSGASLVEPFGIDVDGPAAPSNVRVNGRRFADSPKAESGHDITLEWDATPTDANELVYVEIHGDTSFRCAFHDVGTASLPSEILPKSDALSKTDGLASLSLHRLREQDVRLQLAERQGEETTTVQFDLARTGRFAIVSSR